MVLWQIYDPAQSTMLEVKAQEIIVNDTMAGTNSDDLLIVKNKSVSVARNFFHGWPSSQVLLKLDGGTNLQSFAQRLNINTCH